MTEQPIYTSGSSIKTLWQHYSVFPDRLEFKTHLGDWTIPFGEIEQLKIEEPHLTALLHGRLDLKNFPFGLKLDFSDITEHVALDKKTGLIRRLTFSPEDPAAFAAAAHQAIATWQASRSDPG